MSDIIYTHTQPGMQTSIEPPPPLDEDPRCKCEKFIFCCEPSFKGDCCPVSLYEWLGIMPTDCGDSHGPHCLATCMCLPFKLPAMILLCLPCAFYNSFRNACNHTEGKSYLCPTGTGEH
jgi:hypothetical protein